MKSLCKRGLIYGYGKLLAVADIKQGDVRCLEDINVPEGEIHACDPLFKFVVWEKKLSQIKLNQ